MLLVPCPLLFTEARQITALARLMSLRWGPLFLPTARPAPSAPSKGESGAVPPSNTERPMARTYNAVHRGTGEWSRKLRKATETQRVRRAVRITLRNVDVVVDRDTNIVDATSPCGVEML